MIKKEMSIKTIHPENCHECPFSEQFRSLYQCKFYNRGYLPTGEKEKPPYCMVKSITVEEGEIIEGSVDSRKKQAGLKS